MCLLKSSLKVSYTRRGFFALKYESWEEITACKDVINNTYSLSSLWMLSVEANCDLRPSHLSGVDLL